MTIRARNKIDTGTVDCAGTVPVSTRVYRV
jgi:hypothetical protein